MQPIRLLGLLILPFLTGGWLESDKVLWPLEGGDVLPFEAGNMICENVVDGKSLGKKATVIKGLPLGTKMLYQDPNAEPIPFLFTFHVLDADRNLYAVTSLSMVAEEGVDISLGEMQDDGFRLTEVKVTPYMQELAVNRDLYLSPTSDGTGAVLWGEEDAQQAFVQEIFGKGLVEEGKNYWECKLPK